MENLAILVKGIPQKGNLFEVENFAFERDLNIMKGILSEEYKVEEVKESTLLSFLKNSYGKNLFFYYVGHGVLDFIGKNKLEDIFKNSSGFDSKMFVLDNCSLRRDMEGVELPSKSKVFFGYEVGLDSSIAKVIWDYVVPRRNPLSSLSKESFDSLKHNWIYCSEN